MRHLALIMMLFASACSFSQIDLSQFIALNDSAFQKNAEYQKGNKYQRDAMLFIDMLVNTHPYYIKKERRDSLLATQPAVIDKCKECTSDTTFTKLLHGVLGELRDDHTDVNDMMTLSLPKNKAQKKSSAITPGKKGEVMAFEKSLFHYQIFPEHSICYLQFNSCYDSRFTGIQSQPRWDTTLNEMFAKMDTAKIQTLVVDAQYNSGGASGLCFELLMHLCPFSAYKDFRTFIRLSDMMGKYFDDIPELKKSWEKEGHIDELYPMPDYVPNSTFQQPSIYKGKVIFVQSPMTYSSAGMLMTLARDNHIGTIIGQTSTFSPSHYGEILRFSLPNTGEFGSVSSKFFARPDSTHLYDKTLEPDVKLDLDDKTAVWNYIIQNCK